MRYFTISRVSFINDQLVDAGSRLTDAHLNGAEPGEAWVETDENGVPLTDEGKRELLGANINYGPVQVAPIQPHAPNPTKPQALPSQPIGGVSIAGNRNYVPADGVESNEAADARVTRLRAELAAAEEAAAAVADVADAPLPPTRRGSATASPVAEPGPLDGSIPDLVTHLDSVNDVAELQRLREAETGGKSRAGALSAIDARIAELDE